MSFRESTLTSSERWSFFRQVIFVDKKPSGLRSRREEREQESQGGTSGVSKSSTNGRGREDDFPSHPLPLSHHVIFSSGWVQPSLGGGVPRANRRAGKDQFQTFLYSRLVESELIYIISLPLASRFSLLCKSNFHIKCLHPLLPLPF